MYMVRVVNLKLLKFQFASLRKEIGDTSESPEPNFVFQLVPNDADNERFEDLRQGRKLILAYHGSRLENFHSIIHNGLVSHMNKVCVDLIIFIDSFI